MSMHLIFKHKISKEFSRLIRSKLTSYELQKVNEENNKCGELCATHKYCDPNEYMQKAFEMIVGREINIQNPDDMRLCNDAWHESQCSDFAA